MKKKESSPNVTQKETSTFYVTIFEKGDSGRIMMDNESCVGCSFLIVNDTNASTAYDNPFSCGNMVAGNSCIINWNISANAPLKSEWDVFVNFSYNSTEGKEKLTDTIKTRIVDYKWDDTTGYINSSWNCRKMVNVSSNVTSSGIVEITNFEPSVFGKSENSCKIMNCTKEIRVTEILNNKSHKHIPYLAIENEINQTDFIYTFCNSTNIKFNITLTANQTKSFFIYYNNPLVEIDYTSPTGSVIFNDSFNNLSKTSNETVWQGFFDSHIDFWWKNRSDEISVEDRKSSNITHNSLKQLGYKPQVYVNRKTGSFLNSITNDMIYYYDGHGSILTFNGKNQSNFQLNPVTQEVLYEDIIFADNITNLPNNLNIKFVLISASFSGDNSTTKECLNHTNSNWLSKAFADKNAGCFLGMQGVNVTTGENCNVDSDVFADFTTPFIECFWNRILLGDTIRQAVSYSTNTSLCINLDHAETVILVNSTKNGCDEKLTS